MGPGVFGGAHILRSAGLSISQRTKDSVCDQKHTSEKTNAGVVANDHEMVLTPIPYNLSTL